MPETASTENTGYVAFLRGINVGGNHIVKMSDLKKLLEGLGFSDVTTILASGNVCFRVLGKTTKQISDTLEQALEKRFGFAIPTIVRSEPEIAAMIALDPFRSVTITPEARLYVSLLRTPVQSKLPITYESPDGCFRILAVSKTEIYSMLTVSGSRSVDLMNIIEREFGHDITTRNWNTVEKVAKCLNAIS